MSEQSALETALEGTDQLSPAQLATLDLARTTAAELATLEECLAASPAVVVGSMGQPRPNPLFAEIRAHRALLSKLIESVNRHPDSNTNQARKAARARWNSGTSIRIAEGRAPVSVYENYRDL